MPRVLIIDDHPGTRHTYSALLRCDGYDTATAEDGQTGMSAEHCVAVDLILVDLRLPDMSGVRVVRELRARGVRVPIVLMTAFPDFNSCFEAGAAGATRFVEGPLMGGELSTIVRETLAASIEDATASVSARENEGRTEASAADGRRTLDPRIRKVLRVIDQDPTISIDTLASQSNLSESRLRHLFADGVGVSLSACVRTFQIARAARALTCSSMPTKQIADEVGLADLRKAFKARFGMPPQTYRSTFRR